jgi:hypothetical protein
VSKKQRNKEQERKYVEVFRRVFNGLPDGELLAQEDQERPDAVLVTAQGKIGIEVTRILHESLKRTESESEGVVAAARSIYEKRNLPNLFVLVSVGAEKSFNRKNRNVFATVLANLVADNVPPANNSIDLENPWNNPEGFPYEIHSVSIFRNPLFTRNYWTVASWGWIVENFVESLQETITKKEIPLRGYDTGCAALWLLIVADDSSPSAFFNPSDSTLCHPYVSSFDRVFFLELFNGKASELKLKK